MFSLNPRYWSLLLCVVCLFSPLSPASGEDAKTPPPLQWVTVGPFPNPKTSQPQPEGATRAGFAIDYLGGEAKAILTPGASYSYKALDGTTQEAVVRSATADAQGKVDLAKIYPGAEFSIAYAFTTVLSERDEKGVFFFGSDDWAKVWGNGKQVYSVWKGDGRTLAPKDESFTMDLKKGENSILVKIDQNTGPWSFSLIPTTPEIIQERTHQIEQAKVLTDFMDTEIQCKDKTGFIRYDNTLPELVWRDPEVVRKAFGEVPLTVHWYNSDLKEVTCAVEAGRYLADVEAKTSSGKVIRRMLCVFRAPEKFELFWPPFEIEIAPRKNSPISPDVWKEQQKSISLSAHWMLVESLHQKESGAVLLAGLYDLKPLGHEPGQFETPEALHQDKTLELKKKILGITKTTPLAPPSTKAGAAAPVLHEGSLSDAGMKENAPELIDKACTSWHTKTNLPFTILVARHGVIAYHKAYGNPGNLENPLENRYELASLTKSFSGFLFGMFMDQGLIGLDDPAGKYLTDFPTKGDQVITLHQCLTHTTGLNGHGEWGGMNNPWIDNIIANGIESLSPGVKVQYNGMGFDLAGKVMEMVDGRNIFRIFFDAIFDPLHFEKTTMTDLAFGIGCRARDLAAFGQLLLNKGSYGDKQFMSEQTFAQLMPRNMKEIYPNLETDWEYGLGLSWMRTKHPDAGKGDIPADQLVLSKNTFAHGAATSTVLRVDPDNDLVIAITRTEAGEDYETQLARVLLAVEESLEKPR